MTKIFKNLILMALMAVAITGFAQDAQKTYSGDKISHKEDTSIPDFVAQMTGEKECQLTVSKSEMVGALHQSQKKTFENIGREYQDGYLSYALEHLESKRFTGTIENGYKDLATSKIKWVEQKVTDIPVYGYVLKSGGKKYFIAVVKENCYNPIVGYAVLEDEQVQPSQEVVVERGVAPSQSVGDITQTVTVLPDTSGNTYITNNYYEQQPQMAAQQFIQSPSYGYGDNYLSAGFGVGFGASSSFGVCGASLWSNNVGCYSGPRGGGGSVSCGGGGSVVNNNYSYTYIDNSYTDNSWSFTDNSIHIHDSFNQDPHVVHPPTGGGSVDPPSGDPPIYAGGVGAVDPEARIKNRMLSSLTKNQNSTRDVASASAVKNGRENNGQIARVGEQKSSRAETVKPVMTRNEVPAQTEKTNSLVRLIPSGRVEASRNEESLPKRASQNPGYVKPSPRNVRQPQPSSQAVASHVPSRNTEANTAPVRNMRSEQRNSTYGANGSVTRNNTQSSAPAPVRTAPQQNSEAKPRMFSSRAANERSGGNTSSTQQSHSGNSHPRYNQQRGGGSHQSYQPTQSNKQSVAPRQTSQPRQMSQARPTGGGRPAMNMPRGGGGSRSSNSGFSRH